MFAQTYAIRIKMKPSADSSTTFALPLHAATPHCRLWIRSAGCSSSLASNWLQRQQIAVELLFLNGLAWRLPAARAWSAVVDQQSWRQKAAGFLFSLAAPIMGSQVAAMRTC